MANPLDTAPYLEKLERAVAAANQGDRADRLVKSGTSLVAVSYADAGGDNGVIMASDGQTTAGDMKVDSSKRKIYPYDRFALMASGYVFAIDDVRGILAGMQSDYSDFWRGKRSLPVDQAASFLDAIYSYLPQFGEHCQCILGGVTDEGFPAIYTVDLNGLELCKRTAVGGSGTPFLFAIDRDFFASPALSQDETTRADAESFALRAVAAATKCDTYSGGKISMVDVDGAGVHAYSEGQVRSLWQAAYPEKRGGRTG